MERPRPDGRKIDPIQTWELPAYAHITPVYKFDISDYFSNDSDPDYRQGQITLVGTIIGNIGLMTEFHITMYQYFVIWSFMKQLTTTPVHLGPENKVDSERDRVFSKKQLQVDPQLELSLGIYTSYLAEDTYLRDAELRYWYTSQQKSELINRLSACFITDGRTDDSVVGLNSVAADLIKLGLINELALDLPASLFEDYIHKFLPRLSLPYNIEQLARQSLSPTTRSCVLYWQIKYGDFIACRNARIEIHEKIILDREPCAGYIELFPGDTRDDSVLYVLYGKFLTYEEFITYLRANDEQRKKTETGSPCQLYIKSLQIDIRDKCMKDNFIVFLTEFRISRNSELRKPTGIPALPKSNEKCSNNEVSNTIALKLHEAFLHLFTFQTPIFTWLNIYKNHL